MSFPSIANSYLSGTMLLYVFLPFFLFELMYLLLYPSRLSQYLFVLILGKRVMSRKRIPKLEEENIFRRAFRENKLIFSIPSCALSKYQEIKALTSAPSVDTCTGVA